MLISCFGFPFFSPADCFFKHTPFLLLYCLDVGYHSSLKPVVLLKADDTLLEAYTEGRRLREENRGQGNKAAKKVKRVEHRRLVHPDANPKDPRYA